MPTYLCQFCNEMRDEDHITVCQACNGQLHANSKEQVCATCGRSFAIKKSKEARAKEPEKEILQVPEKALMTVQE